MIVQVAGNESHAANINVGVYYESLCSDSMRWIKQQLLPEYDVLKDYISVTFIPYGKASVSRSLRCNLLYIVFLQLLSLTLCRCITL